MTRPRRPRPPADLSGGRLLLALASLLGAVARANDTDIAAGDATLEGELPTVVVVGDRARQALRARDQALDDARDQDLLPKLGATAFGLDEQALDALPQGQNTPLDKVLLQAPGVSYDSAISNPDFHVRNEYANVQYRINGIQLPDGVSALGPVLETGFIGNLRLLDGVLPAEYGLRTAGVVDLSTKREFDPGGALDVFGGSHATLSPSVTASGSGGATQFFLVGRYFQSDLGLENAMPTVDAIHDHTTQERFFGYGSTLLGDSDRLSYLAGAWVGHFQIPDVAGVAPLGDYGSPALASTSLDGDLAFNDVAARVRRKSLLNGVQFDASARLSERHTLRAGLLANVEETRVDDLATVLPLSVAGDPLPTPLTRDDYTSKRGWTAGAYVQDEWRLSQRLTLNGGLRYDALSQFVSGSQLSPRLALLFVPVSGTTLHIGLARYFTPPMQAQATPTDLARFNGTTQQPAIPLEDPVRPERASYVDVGIEHELPTGFSYGADLYYKHSTDTLDDGQFGQAVVLTQFNYAEGYSRGVELKAGYRAGGLRLYANLGVEETKGKDVNSNQYLIGDPAELAYLASEYTYASDAQTLTASAGAAYRWHDTLATLDGIYGSGLRAGFANEDHSPGYAQWNGALAQNFYPWGGPQPLTVRVSVINLLDRSYVLRSGTGIGEFAPQYGPRRSLFVGLTQAF